MKKLLSFIALLILPAVGLTDDSVFFTLIVQPDVMLILDCSGSMTWDMVCTDRYDYDHHTYGDGSEYYPGRDTDGDGFTDDARLYIAKNAIRRIVQKREKFRWGLETYPGQKNTWGWADWYREPPEYTDSVKIPWENTGDGYDNGQVLVTIAEATSGHLQSIYDYVDNKGAKELRAQGGTPIGGALFVAQQFYKGKEIPADNAKECRRYFNIVVSDGKETGWPDHNDYSPYQKSADLRHTMVDGEEYDIQTYVVGIAVPGGEDAQCLDSIAKMGGTIHYYSAMSPAQLDSVLDVIASDILQKSFAFSAPEVPAVRVKQNDKLYIGSFIPSYSAFWEGHLKCYQLAPDGSIPADSFGVPTEEPIWDAGIKLQGRESDSRRILTEIDGALVDFDSPPIDSATLGVPADSVDDLINWVRGNNGMDWKLGDIFHSEPVAITSPNPFYFEEGYNEFKKIHATRDRVLLVGSNDGMLHAFDIGEYIVDSASFTNGSGEEVWAYIPHNLLPKLKNMRESHQYMVDASPGAADVRIPSGEWKTILVGGERGGGNYYFSLDITDTHNPLYKWAFTDTELGETWSIPMITKVKIKEMGVAKDKWVAVVGGGYSSTNEKGKALYILDIDNGNIILRYDNTYNSDINYAFPSSPTGLDMPPINDYLDRIYIGDIGGQMWRFDVSDSITSSWTGNIIFSAPTAGAGNPIFYPPSLSYDEEDNLWVFFGTGDRENPRDGSSQNRFYGVIDGGTCLGENDIEDITHGPKLPYSNGWYIKLDKGESVLAGTAVLGGTVYFTTYQAVELDDPCAIQGMAKLYKVDFTQGTFTVDTVGTSLPTTPQIIVSPEGKLTIMISLAEGMVHSETSELGSPFKESKYWREIHP